MFLQEIGILASNLNELEYSSLTNIEAKYFYKICSQHRT